MKLVKARVEDADSLTILTKESKAHWGYAEDQLSAWSDDLVVSPDYIQQNRVFNLILDDEIVAYYSLIVVDDHVVRLDNMFVRPTSIGQGFGRYLMQHCISEAKKNQFNKIILDADPNAEAFYLKAGFKVVEHLESSIKDRFLPYMELIL